MATDSVFDPGTEPGFDVIGDIHGHGRALHALLQRLGYAVRDGCWRHPCRTAIFLGDFIDRGEQLMEQRLVLDTVMPMVAAGAAKAVMGNHEFNALTFHTKVNGQPLRAHNTKHVGQHRAFLNEYGSDPAALQAALEFFYTLPLWLDLGDLRAVHACWHPALMARFTAAAGGAHLRPELLGEAVTEGTELHAAVEVLLKGPEAALPGGAHFHDKDGNRRTVTRVKWWLAGARTLREVCLPEHLDLGPAAQAPAPPATVAYAADNPPCFIGHYWFKGMPAPIQANLACVDYSVAAKGRLTAYRWSGEAVLSADNFVSVEP